MFKRIAPLVMIFICTAIAWVFLAQTIDFRTYHMDEKLKSVVGELWGTVHKQPAPTAWCTVTSRKKVPATPNRKVYEQSFSKTLPLTLDGSDIAVDLKLQHRKKGLLWYSTYRVEYAGKYRLTNPTDQRAQITLVYAFPTTSGIYDNFYMKVDGQDFPDIHPQNGTITKTIRFGPREAKTVEVTYRSQGMDEWWYILGSDVTQMRNFKLVMTTDFDQIDFPDNSISPVAKARNGSGWKLTWEYGNLLSGVQIGMLMPKKMNPGPFVSHITHFAPVSLFLFLFLMFIITALRGIDIHPMNYFFVCAAFFSFHLLMAYLVDHVDLPASFIISAGVSIFLVVSYIRLVVGVRFALLEVGLSQFIYLVLFSYSFFLQGYTGLAITVLCIITLFVVMQATGRVDWKRQFNGQVSPGPAGGTSREPVAL